ncbi:MAG TPA: methyl-accepting chemotaxis protein [Ktedonobacteraceae bacterium]|nr:methyl-accepting chemotaxis protein [Ktedonobacteraceae bacterium]
MNDNDRGGMTVSSLMVLGLTASVVIPVIAIIVLGILVKGVPDQTVVVYMIGVCALIVLLGVLMVNYFVRRRILDRVQGLVDVCRRYASGDHMVRALVVGDDEFAMLAMSLNTLFENQGFGAGGVTAAPASGSSDAAALQAQIEKLLQEVSAVGDGDLRVQAEVTPDTLGVLADSFNYMIEELAKVVGRVQSTAMQVTNATRRILDRSDELAQASSTQVEQISQTTEAVEALAIFIQNVARNAQLSTEAAQEALRNADAGQEAVRQSIDGMMVIRENVQETSKKIKRLGERSNEIGEIVRIIEDIADQTNLLALNAAIQSAMAGEHGRGFAVVADEIRLLAERSTESTKRIATLVKSIQGDTFEAVVAMEDSTQEVVKGSQLADEAGRALNSIYTAVERQAQMIETIAHAANEQAQVSENVAVAMGQISEITRQTNAGTQEAAMSVSYLAELADQLRASVSTFRLPDQANEMVEVFPSMAGVPALPGGNADQYYQQDMGVGNQNEWNRGFSSDFLSLPQPQGTGNSGAHQFAFNNQWDFGSQPGFSNSQMYAGQQFNDGSQYASQQGFEGQYLGDQMSFNGQQYNSQQFYDGQQYGNQQGFDVQQHAHPSNYEEMQYFEQQGFEGGQQQYSQMHQMPDSTFGNPNKSPFSGSNQAPGMGQQSFGPLQGQSLPANQRWRTPQPNQSSFGQDQMPFPNNGHSGQ